MLFWCEHPEGCQTFFMVDPRTELSDSSAVKSILTGVLEAFFTCGCPPERRSETFKRLFNLRHLLLVVHGRNLEGRDDPFADCAPICL
jgi:hypothetical protein